MTLYNTIIDTMDQDARSDAMYGEMCSDCLPEGTEYKEVDSGGGADAGSDYYSIYHFKLNDEETYIKFYGYYASYDGASYEGCVEVTPKKVELIQYV